MPRLRYWPSACRGPEYVGALGLSSEENPGFQKKKCVADLSGLRYLFSFPPSTFDTSGLSPEILHAMADQNEIRGNSVYEAAESGIAKPAAVEQPKPKAGFMGKSVFLVRLILQMTSKLTFAQVDGILEG